MPNETAAPIDLSAQQPYAFGSNLDVVWREDPRLLGIRLARYKFVAKMFAGFPRVLEIGAGTGALSPVVAHAVRALTVTDAHPPEGMAAFDPLDGTPADWRARFDGAYALDVLEHVPREAEDAWIAGIRHCLTPGGALIVGMPSLESQPYASRKSRESHVNCMTEHTLRTLLRAHFPHVFLFGMNDEVVHTGFGPMCHYRLALCAL